MNITQDAEPTVTPVEWTPPPTPTPRDAIVKAIAHAQMPVAAEKLAAKLLAKNKTFGTHFVVTMGELRSLCHAATNLDVIKHLRHMRAANLLEYTINFGAQRAEMKFLAQGQKQD